MTEEQSMATPAVESAASADAIPCAAEGCLSAAVVQWRRRLTDPEWADLLAAVQERQRASGDVGPAPVRSECLRAVHACGPHSISVEAGALVHQASCTAPDPARLPGCDCTPEAAPTGAPAADPTVTLPTGWTVPAPTP